MRRASVVSGLALFALLAASPARANFHLVKVVEVFTGTEAAPDAQYVMLQAYSAGQNVLTGHSVQVYDTDGVLIPGGTFAFSSGVLNSSNQMTILLATSAAQTFFNMSADLTIPAILPPGGGMVCWNSVPMPECVAWGGYTGPSTRIGTPYNSPVGIPPGKAIHRKLDICMGAATLEACDDTLSSANDFQMVAPLPRNNAGLSGSAPASTCQNSTLGGVEGCDDGNGTNGDGCSSLCVTEAGSFSPQALSVDSTATVSSDGNGVLEPNETVYVAPSWKNIKTSTLPLRGFVSGWKSAVSATYSVPDGEARYGPLAGGATGTCTPGSGTCHKVAIGFVSRPQTHIDVPLVEALSNGDVSTWQVHVGSSFPDVPKTLGQYRFVETLLHKGITAGCAGGNYCPGDPVTRQQMAVFLLVSKDGSAYAPPACVTPAFADVPCSSGFAKWVNELANRGVVSGCGGGNYCPLTPVNREQMAVFLIATLQPGVTPPACTTAPFADVPCSSPYAKWIQALVMRGITAGCGSGNYCPQGNVSRGQMAVFLTTTFALQLYGP